MTYKGWYAIKLRNQTKPSKTKKEKNSLILIKSNDVILPVRIVNKERSYIYFK